MKENPPLWLQKWQSDARKNLPKNKILLQRLARFKINLSGLQDFHKEAFETVDCLKCGNCCKTAHPIFTRPDVDRISAHLGMKASQFEKQFLVADSDGDRVPNQIPCPFLNEDNTCKVYQVRPKSCRSYPHTDVKEGWERPDLMAKNTVTCPAAFMVVEKLRAALGR